jgi:hypothetical protein
MQLEFAGFPKIGQPALRALKHVKFARLEQLTGVSELELSRVQKRWACGMKHWRQKTCRSNPSEHWR